MSKPLVSIIIPLYNSESFVQECIESAINQTWIEKEIIIIDDGSTDRSLEIARTYQSEMVLVYQQENKGASAARNFGLSKSRGKYVQFLDADDFLSTNKIEAQVLLLEQFPGYIAHCQTIYYHSDTGIKIADSLKRWYTRKWDDPIEFIRRLFDKQDDHAETGGMIQPNAWLTPNELIKKAGKWNERLSNDDDGEFFTRVLIECKGICFSENGKNYYRKFSNSCSHLNLSRQLTENGFKSMLEATNLKYEELLPLLGQKYVDKIFVGHYAQIVQATYPKYKYISQDAMKRFRTLSNKRIHYSGGPISTLIGRFIHWKIIRYINFFRFKI